MEHENSEWMPHAPASAPGAYPSHQDSTWPPAFLDGLQLADEAPSAGQELLGCSGMSAANTRNSNLLLSSGSNAWSAAQQQHGAAAPAPFADPCAAVTTALSCGMLPPSNDTLNELMPEQVDSLLSSSDAPTAPNSACSQLQDVDIVCQMEDRIMKQAGVAGTDCSLESVAWLMGLNTATVPWNGAAPSTTVHMPVPGYVDTWCPSLPAHVEPTNHSPTATRHSVERNQQWQAAASAPQASNAVTPHTIRCIFDAANHISGAKLGATGSTHLRGSSSSNSLSQLRTNSMNFSGTNPQAAAALPATGSAAIRGSSPNPVSVKPVVAAAPSTEARREANKLNQRRQRQRRNEDMELLRSKLAAMSFKHSEVRQKLESLRAENTDLLSRLSDITSKWQATVAVNASLQHENARSKTELVDLQQQLRNMQGQLQQLHLQQWSGNMSWQQQQHHPQQQQQVVQWAVGTGGVGDGATEQQHVVGW